MLRPGKSDVWKHMKRVNSKTIQCLHCNAQLAYHQSTTSAKLHLQKKHDILLGSARALPSTSTGPHVPGSPAELRACFQVIGSADTVVASSSTVEDPLIDPDIPESQPPACTRSSSSSSLLAGGSPTSQDSQRSAKRPRTDATPTRHGSISAAFDRVRGFQSGVLADKVTDAILYMMARDYQPIQIVENQGFRLLMKICAPLYNLPSRATMTSRLMDKYIALKDKYKTKLSHVKELAITMDIWTMKHTTKSYLGLTCHYLENGEMRSINIGVEPLSDRHDSGYISRVSDKICVEWGIKKDSVVAVITDGAANIKKAAKDTFGEDKHLTCFAHLVQLLPQKATDETPGLRTSRQAPVPQPQPLAQRDAPMAGPPARGITPTPGGLGPRGRIAATRSAEPAPGVQAAVQVLPPAPGLIDTVKRIVTYFRQSVNAADLLKQSQMREGKRESECLKLLQDIETRWNSTLHMLERFVALSPHIGAALLSLQGGPQMVSADQLAVLRGIVDLLTPIERVTTELCSEKVTTISKIIPMSKIMKEKIARFNPGGANILQKLKEKLLANMESLLGHVERVKAYGVASVLDPRFKNKLFESAAFGANALTSISNLMTSSCSVQETQSPPAQEVAVAADSDDFWGSHDVLVQQQQQSTDVAYTAGGLPLELKVYLDQPLEDRKSDPFVYWETAQARFPILAPIARRYLSIPATSVPSERLFSKAGYIASERRSRLKSSLLQALLFTGSLSAEEWAL